MTEPVAAQSRAGAPGDSALPILYSLSVGLVGLAVLAYQILAQPLAGPAALPWGPIVVFSVLSFLVQRSSFHFGSPTVHSLAGIIDVAAVLALGPVAGGAVAAGSGAAYLELNGLRRHTPSRRRLVDIPVFNAGLKALAAFAGGVVFRALDGSLPLADLTWPSLGAALAVCAVWFAIDQIGWTIFDYLDAGRQAIDLLAKGGLRQVVLLELLPLLFSAIVALGYTRLDRLAFVLMALAVVVVAVLAQRWADTRNELVRRVAELSTIDEIGRTIVQARLDVDELCRLMYDHARRLVDTTIFHLGLFEGENYTIKLWMREGEEEPARTFRLEPGTGLVSWLRESKQPILVGDFHKETDSLPAKPVYVSDAPPRSAVFVPLLAGDLAIGTLSIQSFRPYAYHKSDLRVLSAMANQAAVAIQKAQLYTQEVRRARELETIGQVSRHITATLELDELFQRVVHLIRDNFRYYHVALYTVDAEKQDIAFQASASAAGQDVAFQVTWGQGLIGWVAEHCRPLVVNDVSQDDRYRCIDALEETQSEIAVPLLLDEERELVGVLDVQSDRLNAFSPDDRFILETLSDQIAIAIQEARLYTLGREQAWFSTALLQVADATSRLSDMDQVLASIARLTPLLAGVDRCAILLWDACSEAFAPGQTYGVSPDLHETFEHMIFRPGALPALDTVRRDKRPVLVTASDNDLLPRHLAEALDIEEMLILPLLTQGELLGAMMVDYAGTAHTFTERMVTMLSGIANQAAMIVHSARLVQAQQEEAYVSTVLLQVAEAVSRSLDLGEILSTIVRITPLLVGVDMCAIFLRDRTGSGFMPAQQYGLDRETWDDFARLRLGDDSALVSGLLAGQPFAAAGAPSPNDADLAALIAVFRKQSVLGLPLLAKSEVVGLMLVDYSGTEHGFTQRWLNILTGIAGQTAIAVENDRLLRETAEQERTRQELDVARRIQSSFLPDCCPVLPSWDLAAVWRSARQVGGDFYDFIPLPPDLSPDAIELRHGQARPNGADRLGLVVADVADKGVPAALFMALSRTLIRTVAFDGRPPSQTLARANDLILSDARADLFVTALYAVLEAEAGRVRYANAGHMPPIVVRGGSGKAELLSTHGMALGILTGIDMPEATACLEPGDILILYTDGLVEATDSELEFFGRDRLIDVIQQHRGESAGQLVEAIRNAITAFSGDAAQFDDVTLLVAKHQA